MIQGLLRSGNVDGSTLRMAATKAANLNFPGCLGLILKNHQNSKKQVKSLELSSGMMIGRDFIFVYISWFHGRFLTT